MDKSPLRYPGGKSKVAHIICGLLPSLEEYREPFVGGGSVALRLIQTRKCSFWINDLNQEVYYFWQQVKENLPNLINGVSDAYVNFKTSDTPRVLFESLQKQNPKDLRPLQRAVRFFVLNRTSFSGTTESGGFSQSAFEHRFTQSSVDRLLNLGVHLNNNDVKISNFNYAKVVNHPSDKKVVIYCDPPYLSAKKLYGNRGNLHDNFDHEKFANIMRLCPHKWLITYDDCPQIREMFSFANIQDWKLRYSMNAERGETNELIITNY